MAAPGDFKQIQGLLRKAEQAMGNAYHELEEKAAEIEYLTHKLARAEEFNKSLKVTIQDELSHHARYNAVKAESKELLDDDTRNKLLNQSRDRAKKILETFMKDQNVKYADFQEKEKRMEATQKKKRETMREEGANWNSDASFAGQAAPSAKKGKSSNGGANGTKEEKKPKKTAIPTARARFISDITPKWKAEKEKAKAAGKDFPGLFAYVTGPWNNMDPKERKRKYEDPYEADVKKAKEEGDGAPEGKKKKKKLKPKKDEEDSDDEAEGEGEADAGNDSEEEAGGDTEEGSGEEDEGGEEGEEGEEGAADAGANDSD